jgi:hypothetical protein
MFDLGQSKLQYLGKFIADSGKAWNSHIIEPGGQWQLIYFYPVFTWLHDTLEMGWRFYD